MQTIGLIGLMRCSLTTVRSGATGQMPGKGSERGRKFFYFVFCCEFVGDIVLIFWSVKRVEMTLMKHCNMDWNTKYTSQSFIIVKRKRKKERQKKKQFCVPEF